MSYKLWKRAADAAIASRRSEAEMRVDWRRMQDERMVRMLVDLDQVDKGAGAENTEDGNEVCERIKDRVWDSTSCDQKKRILCDFPEGAPVHVPLQPRVCPRGSPPLRQAGEEGSAEVVS